MGKKSRKNQTEHRSLTVGDTTYNVTAYRVHRVKYIGYCILCLVTVFFFRLFAHWYKKLMIRFKLTPTTHHKAEQLFITDTKGQIEVIKEVKNETYPNGVLIPDEDGNWIMVHNLRYFTFRKGKYIWYEKLGEWINPADLDSQAPFSTYFQRVDDSNGLAMATVMNNMAVYGPNSLNIELTPLPRLLVAEILTPFYLFQMCSVTLWYTDNYYFYASVIIVITVGSAGISLYQLRKQEKRVKEMVGGTIQVTVIRDGVTMELNSTELVPGDILLLPAAGLVMPCDGLLLNGSAIVNEAMLTGESVPVTKTPLSSADDLGPSVRFSNEKHGRHILYCGTQVLQARCYGGVPVRVLVVRTGFSTLKGQLVRSILYPAQMDAEYMRDLFSFVFFLGCISMIGFTYTVALMIYFRDSPAHIIIRALDLITIVVPPALPAAMSVGILNANVRLRKRGIFCISPSTINTCGQINVVCFDKTGTLTEDGLDFQTLRGIRKNSSGKPEFSEEFTELNTSKMVEMGVDRQVVNAVATCHSLTRIDGRLLGDPLDLILFNKSGWSIEEGSQMDTENELFDNVQPTVFKPNPSYAHFHKGCKEYSIVKQFPFSSALQRMAVIVANPSEDTGHEMQVFCKGSPEMIASLCDPATIPDNYQEIVNAYAQRGFRLISIAHKHIDSNFARAAKAPRDTIECDLELLGLIVMENRLKPESLGVINQLNRSNIRTVMVTGDNLLTAMSVARECGIIRPTKPAYLVQHDPIEKDHLGRSKIFVTKSVSSSEDRIDVDPETVEFDHHLNLQPSQYHMAIAGPTFTVMTREYPELVDNLVATCDVFARMAPDQKSGLIGQLQKLNYKVAMCGDGANDCAALKAADSGISLSDAEASIAAPFTSKVANISCVVEVVREGRCALTTSFAIFKYMSAYSLCEFTNVLLNYGIKTNLTDFQFMYVDFVLTTIVALFLGNTGPCEQLSPTPPPRRLMSIASFMSVIGQVLINFVALVTPFWWASKQSWYIPYNPVINPGSLVSQQGTILFMVSSFQYLGFVFVYSASAPYRKSIFTNWPLVLTVVIIGAITFFIDFFPPGWVRNVMGLEVIPSPFKWYCMIFSFGSVIISIFYEHIIVANTAKFIDRKIKERNLRKMDEKAPLHERILSVIGRNPMWLDESLALQGNSFKSLTTESETAEESL